MWIRIAAMSMLVSVLSAHAQDAGTAVTHSSEILDDLAKDADLSAPLIQKLAPEQLEKILTVRAHNDDNRPPVAIVVPLAFFAMSIGLVALILYGDFRKARLKTELLKLAIEKGQPLPPELLGVQKPGSDLRTGLVLVGLGFALALVLFVLGPKGSWSIGTLPLLAGSGYLLAWRIERPRAVQSK